MAGNQYRVPANAWQMRLTASVRNGLEEEVDETAIVDTTCFFDTSTMRLDYNVNRTAVSDTGVRSFKWSRTLVERDEIDVAWIYKAALGCCRGRLQYFWKSISSRSCGSLAKHDLEHKIVWLRFIMADEAVHVCTVVATQHVQPT